MVEHIRPLNRRSSAEDVNAAVQRAFYEIETGAGTVVQAQALWEDFLNAVGDTLDNVQDFIDLKVAWKDAVSWKERLDSGVEIDRQDMKGDIMTFSDYIRDLAMELESLS